MGRWLLASLTRARLQEPRFSPKQTIRGFSAGTAPGDPRIYIERLQGLVSFIIDYLGRGVNEGVSYQAPGRAVPKLAFPPPGETENFSVVGLMDPPAAAGFLVICPGASSRQPADDVKAGCWRRGMLRHAGRVRDGPTRRLRQAVGSRWIADELRKVQNAQPAVAKYGGNIGTVLGGIDMWMRTLSPPCPPPTSRLETARLHLHRGALTCIRVDYPSPTGVITFR